MPISPGLYIRDLQRPAGEDSVGVRVALVGTSRKGPVNEPILVRDEQEYVSKFGEPDQNHYLGYCATTALEAGLPIYVERVAVAYDPGLPEDLRAETIDVSGTREHGWGRIPIFVGCDFGRIKLRTPTQGDPYVFHGASASFKEFIDLEEDPIHGSTSVAASVGGVYDGDRDETIAIQILSSPSSGLISGAEYSVVNVRNDRLLDSGVLSEASPGVSSPIVTSLGISVVVSVTGAPLAAGDTVLLDLVPDNLVAQVWVDRAESGGSADYVSATFNDGDVFRDPESFAKQFNLLSTTNKMAAIWDGDSLSLVTIVSGDSIQLVCSSWAMEVGQSPFAYDIPHSHIVGANPGPFSFTSSNNQVILEFSNALETFNIGVNIPVSMTSVSDVAGLIDNAGTRNNVKVYRAYSIEVGESQYLCIETSNTYSDYSIRLVADNQHPKVRGFASLVGFDDSVAVSRSFSDSRPILPPASADLSVPSSCVSAHLMCHIDAAYYQHILGWIVASSPGTWVEQYQLQLSLGDVVHGVQRYNIEILNDLSEVVHQVFDISFNPDDDRHVDLVTNAQTGDDTFISWIPRPEYLGEPHNYEPCESTLKFIGAADGVPSDPAYSSELDNAIIGNPATSTGLFAYQDHESFDIDVLAAPGFMSGAVVGNGIQICQSRGDCIFLVDVPYGLSPEQAIQWHNGMLLSDMRQAINSSFAASYYSWIRRYDKYNRMDVWIPPSCYASKQFALLQNPWQAPAGLDRGRLSGAVDIEYDTTLGERDFMCSSGNAVNPIINRPGDGIIIWGQKTLQRSQSALSYVNVRLLINTIVQLMRYRLRRFVFAQNDETTRDQITTISNMLFEDLVARNAIYGYQIVCDETNNTDERIARNELWLSAFVKPARTADVIELSVNILIDASLLTIAVA